MFETAELNREVPKSDYNEQVPALRTELLEAQQMIRGLEGMNLVGGDVVEVAPPFDVGGMTALVGATLMFEILCVLAKSIADRR